MFEEVNAENMSVPTPRSPKRRAQNVLGLLSHVKHPDSHWRFLESAELYIKEFSFRILIAESVDSCSEFRVAMKTWSSGLCDRNKCAWSKISLKSKVHEISKVSCMLMSLSLSTTFQNCQLIEWMLYNYEFEFTNCKSTNCQTRSRHHATSNLTYQSQ